MDLVKAVNQQGSEDWTKVGWGVQALMVEYNLKKAGKKVPDQDSNPMDEEGRCIIENWIKSTSK